MATVHPGNGGGIERPCLVAQRGVVLPRATVAPGIDGLKQDAGWGSWCGATQCAQMEVNRGRGGVENRLGGLMTG